MSFEQKERKVTKKEFTVCDGVRTNIGENTWPMILDMVDHVITVSDEEVAKGTKNPFFVQNCFLQ